MKKKIWTLLICLCLLCGTVCSAMARDIMPDTWVLTDDLGRSAGTNGSVGNLNTSRQVGIFYFLWHQSLEGTLYDHHRAYMQGGVDKVWAVMQLGPKGYAHYWSEPYFGYYSTEDDWIIRKHIQLLTDAGIDFLYFDTSNGELYAHSVEKILNLLMQMKEEGEDVPKVCFLLGDTAPLIDLTYTEAWEKFYNSTKYDALWFKWEGKPLIFMRTNELNSKYADKVSNFTIRGSWTGSSWYGNGNGKWPWIYDYPQAVGKSPSGNTEQVIVSCGFHANSSKGRSYHGGRQPSDGLGAFEFQLGTTIQGLAFAEQWSRVMQVKPPIVMITGWNEWWAGRWEDAAHNQKIANTYICDKNDPVKRHYYVDCFNPEFSRDVEMSKYGIRDNYYNQMVQLIRTYKGARPIPEGNGARTPETLSDWSQVTPAHLDDLYDTTHRYFRMNAEKDPDREEDEFYTEVEGMGYYKNTTGRNDIDTCKVTRDKDFVYFYVSTREAMTQMTETDWLTLFIDADAAFGSGWYGYDFMVGRKNIPGNRLISVEACNGSWSWRHIGYADVRMLSDKEAVLAIPREWLGFRNHGKVTFDYKWADHIQYDSETGMDIMQFYDRGDVAPNSRFNYRYYAEFPAYTAGVKTWADLSVDIAEYPNVTAWLLGKLSVSIEGLSRIEYTSYLDRGEIKDGVYVPYLALGAYRDETVYRGYDETGKLLVIGKLSLCNEENAEIVSFKNVNGQSFVVNYMTNEAKLTVPYNTKFWDVTLISNASGTVTIGGKPVDGNTLFYFMDQNTNIPLVYTKNGESVTYALSVVRADAPTSVVNDLYPYVGTQLPGDHDLWKTQWGTFTVTDINGTTALAPDGMDQNNLLSLKEPFPTPYTLTCNLITPGAQTGNPYQMSFFNIRSTSRVDYPTEYRGIWFGVYKNQVCLMIKNTNFAVNDSYSVATITDAVDMSSDFGGVKVHDDGEIITISALTTTGAYKTAFTITNITSSDFRYTNAVTSETGTGVSRVGSISLAGGYMSVFHHGRANMAWSNIHIETAYKPVEVGLAISAILDADTGREISNGVAIDNTKNTLYITVAPGTDLSSVRLMLIPTVAGNTVVRLNNKVYQGTPVDLSKLSGRILFVGGGKTKTYNLTIAYGVSPRFELSGTASYTANVDNAQNKITISIGQDFDLSSLYFNVISAGEMKIDGQDTKITWFDFNDALENHEVVYTENGESMTYQLSFVRSEPSAQYSRTLMSSYNGADTLPADKWVSKYTGVYTSNIERFGKKTLSFTDVNQHHLLTSKNKIAPPYVMEYEVSIQASEKFMSMGSFLNLRSTSNVEYPTGGKGIWFNIRGSSVYLYKNPTELNEINNYSEATAPEIPSTDNSFMTIRIEDSGSEIILYAETEENCFVKLFRIYNIGNSTYSYDNCITGESGLGNAKAGTIANEGYINFFSHLPSISYFPYINFYELSDFVDGGLGTFALYDAQGNTVTTHVEINSDIYPYTIKAYVAQGTDVTALSAKYTPTTEKGVLKLNGKDCYGKLFDASEIVPLVYNDASIGKVYTLSVEEENYTSDTVGEKELVKFRFTAPDKKAGDSVAFIIAFYDEEGRMISAYPSLRPVKEDANVFAAFMASKKPQNAVTARVFLWDGFETISDTMTLFE